MYAFKKLGACAIESEGPSTKLCLPLCDTGQVTLSFWASHTQYADDKCTYVINYSEGLMR